MRAYILFFFFCLYGTIITAQMQLSENPAFDQAIRQTGIIHSLLPVDYSKSLEALSESKKVLYSEPLCEITNNLNGWKHSGLGAMTFSREKSLEGNGCLKVEYPASINEAPVPYSFYGKCFADFLVNGANWERFNRISFWVYPDCQGARVLHMSLLLHNDGKVKIPYEYNREGAHYINVKNHEWNHVLLEMDENGRDKIVRFAFSFAAMGKDISMSDEMKFYVDKIELQQIEDTEKTVGWEPGNNRVVYSTVGYALNSEKTAIVNMNKNLHNNTFQLIDAQNNQVIFNGEVTHDKTTIGEFDILNFSTFNQVGEYYLKVGNVLTPTFRISERIWENSLWRVLNFVFGERCGYAVPGGHGICHTDIFAEHDGKKIMYAGGWHDAGDMSQFSLQTGDVTYTLLEAYNKLKNKNEMLAVRMLEEAEWGLQFILRCRFGDGYRVSSVDDVIWTDGIVGTIDDIARPNVHNGAFDNFLYAAYEAYASLSVDRDPMLQESLIHIAKEDFEFAMKRHSEVGYGDFNIRGEHSFNTSESQYMATISWSASMLYQLTKDKYYADIATLYIQYTMDCQRKTSPYGRNELKGFFYRDKTKKVAVHYNHQSRDQVYMQALILLCETQPQHSDFNRWMESIRLYGDYLKAIMPYTAPYGMIASGIYRTDEVNDPSLDKMYMTVKEGDSVNFIEQVKNGVQLDKEHYLKRFPVWLSHRGNAAVHLSSGKAAALCGHFLDDKELMRIGQEQLYWLVGKNPFGQSLVYGEGTRYGQMFSPLPGTIVGEMPVGMQTRYNGDEPCWPMANNSVYKEVWVTSAGKWISLAIEY
jgi:hypothetical protein